MMTTTQNKRDAVLKVLKEAPDEGWITTLDITNAECGTEGTRRLRELRDSGLPIEKRKAPKGTQYQYRIAS